MTNAGKQPAVWFGDYETDELRRQQAREQVRKQAIADVTKATEAIRDRLRRDLAAAARPPKRPRPNS